MNKLPAAFDDTVWTKENYKTALRMTQVNPPRIMNVLESLVDVRIKALPIDYLRKYFTSVRNKEFRFLPFRVNGLAKSQAEFEWLSNRDIVMNSFTIYNKHAFMTVFIFEMSDTQIQKEPFVQVSIERFYSRRKGYGSKILQQMVRKAKEENVVLTVWNENEKVKDYFVKHGFDYQYKSLTTGHYFSTYNLNGGSGNDNL